MARWPRVAVLLAVALLASGAAAHGHSGCGHSRVAGESRRWSDLHRQQAQLALRAPQLLPDAGAAEGAEAAGGDLRGVGASWAPNASDARPTPRMLAEGPATVPIRVFVEYQGIDALDAEGEQHLRDTVNVALGVLQKFYKVRRPAPGRLLVRPFCRMWESAYYCLLHQPDFLTGNSDNTCGSANINSSHIAAYEQCGRGGRQCSSFPGGGGEFTDYYLYITALQDEHCASGAVAWALPCLYDTETNRPLLGSANICPKALLQADKDSAVSVLVHELTHALGFTDDMFDKFIDDSGAPVPKSQVVQKYVDPYGRTTAMIVTPTVVTEARAQFGCDTLPGAALENEGGQGSANAHWEYRWFQGELMVATNLFAVYGKPATMSRITLAFMQDTGWYDISWDAAGFLNWGYQAGCSFVEKTCTDWVAANPGQQFFCTREQYADDVNTVCTFDGLARAKCEDAQFADGCIMKVALGTVPNCLSRQYSAAAGDKFGWQNGLSSRCAPVTWLFTTPNYQFPDSSYKDGWRDSMCYASSCTTEGVLQLDVLGNKVACPTGETVDLAAVLPGRFRRGLIGPCPDNAAMCSSLACNESCTVGGTCVSGACYCNLQYTGPECGKKLTPDGNYTNYVPVVDAGSAGPAAFDNGYLMMSAKLASSQEALYLSLDKYKLAVAQLAGVTTTRVAVLSFLTDAPARSLWGHRRSLLAAPGGGSTAPARASSSAASSSAAAAADGASSSNSSSAFRLLLQDASAGLAGGPAWDADVTPPQHLRSLLASGELEVFSRIATLSQADADAIAARIANASRQAAFAADLDAAGLTLVPGSVGVRSAGAGSPGSWGVPALNMDDPGTRRIIIIVACAVGAALLAVFAGWAVAACLRRRRAWRGGGGRSGGPPPALQQQFLAHGSGGRPAGPVGQHGWNGAAGGAATPSSGSSDSDGAGRGGGGGLRPLFGAPAAAPAAARGASRSAPGGGSGGLANPFAGSAAAAALFGGSGAGGARYQQQPQPGRPLPVGGYTVQGRTFATAREAEEYQLALALQRSLQQTGPPGHFLPHSSRSGGSARPGQLSQAQVAGGSAYPPVSGFGWGGVQR